MPAGKSEKGEKKMTGKPKTKKAKVIEETGKVFLKVHRSPRGITIAICDAEQIGKSLEEGEIVLDLNTYKNFYHGKEMDIDEAAAFVKKNFSNTLSINAVGRRALKAVQAAGLDVSGALMIQGVPHLQVFRYCARG